MLALAETTTILNGVITASVLQGVFNEIVGLIPVVVPTIVGFLAVRKGLAFAIGAVRRA